MENAAVIIVFLLIAVVSSYCIYCLYRPAMREDFASNGGKMTDEEMEAYEIMGEVLNQTNISDQCKNLSQFCLTGMRNCNDSKSRECLLSSNFCDTKELQKLCDPKEAEIVKIIQASSDEDREKIVRASEIVQKHDTKKKK